VKNLLFVFVLCCCIKCDVFAQNARGKADSLLNVLQTAREDTNKVKVLNSLGWVLLDLSDYRQTRVQLNGALSLADKLRFRKGIAEAYFTMGILEEYVGNNAESIRNLFASLKIYEELKANVKIAGVYNSLGNAFMTSRKDSMAIYFYKACITLSEEIGFKDGLASGMGNLSDVYRTKGKGDEALKYSLLSLKIYEETGNKLNQAVRLRNLAIIYIGQLRYDEAIRCAEKAIRIAEELNSRLRIAEGYVSLGTIYRKMGAEDSTSEKNTKLNLAKDQYNKALQVAEDIGAKHLMKFIYASLSSVYYDMKDYETAIHMLWDNNQLKDSLYSDASSRQVENLRVEYEKEKSTIEEKARLAFSAGDCGRKPAARKATNRRNCKTGTGAAERKEQA
jgi:tetratricopeptide (TPR) repeat protein